MSFLTINKKRRTITDKILKPLLILLKKLKISPNNISLLGIISISLSAYFIFLNNPILASIFLLLKLFLDIVDGGLARIIGLKKSGFVFDYLSDSLFTNLLTISLFSINLISFEIMLINIFSMFLLTITDLIFKLYNNKEYNFFPLPLDIIAIFCAFFNNFNFSNNLYTLISIYLIIFSLTIFTKIE